MTTNHYSLSILLSSNEESTMGTAEITVLTRGERITKAIWKGLLGFFVTAFTIAIPLLHFVLVPLGLLITVGLVMSSLSRTEFISGGTALCAYCGHEIQLVKRKVGFPFLERCTSCSRESTVNKA